MLASDSTLKKDEILRSFGRIRRLFKDGTGGYVYPFRYIVYAEPSEKMDVKVLFSTPKKFHKRAIRRNRLRRCMKELYRTSKNILLHTDVTADIDLALVYSSKEMESYETMRKAIQKILNSVRESL